MPDPTPRRADTVLLDVDGTLMDTTYHHALAWHRAFRAHGVPVPIWRVHRAIGMGGDKLVAAVAGAAVEKRLGDALREWWQREYETFRSEIAPLPGAHDLLALLKAKGFRVALASSGLPAHTQQAVELLDAADLLDAVTTAEDAERSKPDPDILLAALGAAGGSSAVMVGDSPYDVEAASRIGAPCLGVRTGGFGEDELRRAGAALVVGGVQDLLEADWDALATETP
jgi:HAD superfamily hydrolase (TIGR01549 family)